MKIIDWINLNYPGNMLEYDDRFEIAHQSGDCSTLFKNSSKRRIDVLSKLDAVYLDFDGMDLFSSTFKIASINSVKVVEGVELIEPLSSLGGYASSMLAKFPESAVPFMYQAGIGIYAVDAKSGKIYEWDEEQMKIANEYDHLDNIFQEWLDAIK